MKKRYLPKTIKAQESEMGAYDKQGKWWPQADIQVFTGGVIKMCFGKERHQIKIIDRKLLPSGQS